jgi:transposase InsO family protein
MSDELPAAQRHTDIALFRYTLILPLLRSEHPPGGKQDLRRQIAARHHAMPHSSRCRLSVPTLCRWERLYRQHGFEGLKPKPRSDRGQARVLSPETLARAETLKREQPHRSARSIITMLTMDQTNPIAEDQLAPRTLRRHLAQRGATTAQLLSGQHPKPFRRFERAHFGDLWQGDAMDGPWLPDPANPDKQRQVFLFAFLDDHTRLIPQARFYWNEQLPRLEDCFKRALMRCGIPLAIYVDQGAVYKSGQLNTICATLGIQRILARPYAPQGKGKVERLFRFIQSDFLPELARADIRTLPQLNQSLLAWIEIVYHRKIHSETGQAPLERYRQDPQAATRPADPTILRQAFLHRASRKVTQTATFSFHANRYQTPDYLRGQTIELRFDPFDLSRLEIWHNDTFLQVAQPERLLTTTDPQFSPDPTPLAPARDSALDYLALLRAERERLIQAQLDPIHFSQLPLPDTKSNDDHDQQPPAKGDRHDRPQ